MTVDAERVAQLGRSVRQIDVAPHAAPLAHQLDSLYRLDRANQHGAWLALGASDGVEAPVHAVDEIDVRDARRPVERLCARGQAGGRVAGQIVLSDVRFRFNDAAGGDAVSGV